MRRGSIALLLLTAACSDGTAAPADPAPTAGGAGTAAVTTTASAGTDASSGTDASRGTDASPPTTTGVVPAGFATIAAVATTAGGARCDLCLWLAADPESRARGLMHVTDLGGSDGMAFHYDAPHATSFTMRNTVLPLSIAFFGVDGRFLDAFDMVPCAAEPCPSYPTPAGFVVAVEVLRGTLDELGMGPGSTLELLSTGCG